MEEINYKAIVVVALIVVALFSGGLYYIISENNNREVAMSLVREYIRAEPSQQLEIEAEIRRRIQKPPIAMTSRASFDSFEQLVANARACEIYAAQAVFSPRGSEPDVKTNTDEAWRYCMDHPEVLMQAQ